MIEALVQAKSKDRRGYRDAKVSRSCSVNYGSQPAWVKGSSRPDAGADICQDRL